MRVVERRELLFDDHFYRPIWRLSGDIYRDHKHFYSADTMSLLGLAVGLHAVLANTPLDEEFRDAVQRNAQHHPDALAIGQYVGETWIVLPGIAAIWGLDEVLERSCSWRHPCGRCVGDWARQSGRAFIVGAPITGVLQVVIGASRPGESSAGSRWKPFDDNNGASGHAFVGAVPFLIAAKQVDNPLLKSTLLLGSGFTALSRIYEDKHYLSQAFLGYWIAYLAVEATHKTESSAFQYRLVPLGLNGQFGLGLELRY
jgi:hypothetical protein